MSELIKEKLAILKRMQDKCITEKRILTDDESLKADRILNQIEDTEDRVYPKIDIRTTSGLANTVPKSDGYVGGPRNSESRSSSKPYELRNFNDKKDFRSLYGSGRNTHEWTDRESSFYQVLFSGR